MARIQVFWLTSKERSAGEDILRRLRQRLGEDQIGEGTEPASEAEG